MLSSFLQRGIKSSQRSEIYCSFLFVVGVVPDVVAVIVAIGGVVIVIVPDVVAVIVAIGVVVIVIVPDVVVVIVVGVVVVIVAVIFAFISNFYF